MQHLENTKTLAAWLHAELHSHGINCQKIACLFILYYSYAEDLALGYRRDDASNESCMSLYAKSSVEIFYHPKSKYHCSCFYK